MWFNGIFFTQFEAMFFDECVSQKFYLKDHSDGLLIRYRDDVNNVIEDANGNANGYQSHVMDISGELTTFCTGGPRFFENNVFNILT